MLNGLIFTFLVLTIFTNPVLGQKMTLPPDYYETEKEFSDSLLNIVQQTGLDGDFDVGDDGIEKISFAVIDMKKEKPVIGGVNMENFVYPASVYKMYIAAAILKKISNNKLKLNEIYVVKSPNDVDKSKEIFSDPRPLLRHGDTVTINYLLDLMITRSDNSAANCLIDIAARPFINEMMRSYNWHGSEVTRKFLSRKFEDPGYDTIKGTETSALHAADFLYRIETNSLVNPWVSMQIKTFLGRQLDKSKLAAGLPDDVMFYHKTGWWSVYTNDAGIVDDGKLKYIIALFTPIEEELALPQMKELSYRVYHLMKRRNSFK
jgi:beta-lactamase class A